MLDVIPSILMESRIKHLLRLNLYYITVPKISIKSLLTLMETVCSLNPVIKILLRAIYLQIFVSLLHLRRPFGIMTAETRTTLDTKQD